MHRLLRSPPLCAVAGLAAAVLLLWLQHAWLSPMPWLSELPFWHPDRWRMELPLVLAVLLVCAWPTGRSRAAWFVGDLAGALPVGVAWCAVDLCCRSLNRPPGLGDLALLPELLSADPWVGLAAIALLLVVVATLLFFFGWWCRDRTWRERISAGLMRGLLLLALAVAFASGPARRWWLERVDFHTWSDLHNVKDYGRLSACWAVTARGVETRLRLAAMPPPADAPAFPLGEVTRQRNVYLLLLESLVDPRDLVEPVPAAVPAEFIAALPPDGRFDHCLAPVFGGCSAQSEFELLTGAPALAAIGPIEYLAFGSRPCDGLVASAAAAGYRTVLVYGAGSEFFNAPRAHASLGFSERHYGNLDPWGERNPADRFITDADLQRAVLDRLRGGDDRRPRLLLLVGMEGHEQEGLTFPRDRARFPDVVACADPVVGELANLFHWRAKALASTLTRLTREDPDAAILVLADHQPAALTGVRSIPAGRYVVPAALLVGGRRVSIAGRRMHELPWLLWGLLRGVDPAIPSVEGLRQRYSAIVGSQLQD